MMPREADAESRIEAETEWVESALRREAARTVTFLSGGSRMQRPDAREDLKARVDSLAGRMSEAWRTGGMGAFRAAQAEDMPFPSASVWPRGPRAAEMEAAVAGVMLCLFLILLAGHLSMGSRDLAKVGWDMEWLYTFPVRSRALFTAKMLEYAFIDPFGWIVSFPILFTVYWCAGLSWHSLWLAPVASASLSIMAGSVQIAAEAALRRRLSPRGIKNVQAGMTAFFLPLFMVLMSMAYSTILLKPFLRAAIAASPALEWMPWALPAHADNGFAAAAGGAAVACGNRSGCSGAAHTRGGAVREGGAYRRRRRA